MKDGYSQSSCSMKGSCLPARVISKSLIRVIYQGKISFHQVPANIYIYKTHSEIIVGESLL